MWRHFSPEASELARTERKSTGGSSGSGNRGKFIGRAAIAIKNYAKEVPLSNHFFSRQFLWPAEAESLEPDLPQLQRAAS